MAHTNNAGDPLRGVTLGGDPPNPPLQACPELAEGNQKSSIQASEHGGDHAKPDIVVRVGRVEPVAEGHARAAAIEVPRAAPHGVCIPVIIIK